MERRERGDPENSEDPTEGRRRDRTKPRKRRFDSGPDPEKIKQEMLKGRERDYQKNQDEEKDKALSNPASKKPNYVGSDKHAKRAYIGNIPPDTDHNDLQIFLNISLREAGGCLEEGNPVLSSSFVNLDKRFLFVELRTVAETTCIMQLDGIKYRNQALKIRRPVDYDKNSEVPPEYPIPKLNLAALGIVTTNVEDSELKLYVGGLPISMDEEKVKLILKRYGTLKSFHLVKEINEIISKGFAFCEYTDKVSTEAAIQYLNGYKIDGKPLVVKYAKGMNVPTDNSDDPGDVGLSDYDRLKKQIDNRAKKEQEERLKRQQELERKRQFEILSNGYKQQQQSKAMASTTGQINKPPMGTPGMVGAAPPMNHHPPPPHMPQGMPGRYPPHGYRPPVPHAGMRPPPRGAPGYRAPMRYPPGPGYRHHPGYRPPPQYPYPPPSQHPYPPPPQNHGAPGGYPPRPYGGAPGGANPPYPPPPGARPPGNYPRGGYRPDVPKGPPPKRPDP